MVGVNELQTRPFLEQSMAWKRYEFWEIITGRDTNQPKSSPRLCQSLNPLLHWSRSCQYLRYRTSLVSRFCRLGRGGGGQVKLSQSKASHSRLDGWHRYIDPMDSAYPFAWCSKLRARGGGTRRPAGHPLRNSATDVGRDSLLCNTERHKYAASNISNYRNSIRAGPLRLFQSTSWVPYQLWSDRNSSAT